MLLARFNRLLSRHLAVNSARLTAGRPIASITFDDFPKSAWTEGGPVLARHGARATYYTSGSFCGRTVEGRTFYDRDDLRALKAAGHEIACHSFAHQPTPDLSAQQLSQDAAHNAEFLKPFLNGGQAQSYAFPYGLASPRTKRFFAERFTNVRGVHPRLNSGRADLALLNAMSMETRCWDAAAIGQAITRARHDYAWIVFYTHGVSETPGEYDSTPAMLSEVLGRLAEARIEILPMRDAVKAAIG
ncbi:MAG TPA: polysaccharide deacetylase family protein [Rhizomicrobium sp.]|jgi:peptidoglycan/xylan/chitin deacetylase (PgdA/CDA1 family)|nr:polysaccharide deacetylase family protein [Rhizomicrobium sp.]